MAAVAPIGTLLTTADAQILGGVNTALQGIAPLLAIPVVAACAILLGEKGVKIANGDAAALQSLWFDFVKIIAVVFLTLNIGNYDDCVLDFFYTTIPAALNGAVAGGANSIGVGVNGTAAAFDTIYLQANDAATQVWQSAGIIDIGTRLAAFLCAATMDLLIAVMAFTYVCWRLLLGIVLVFGMICIPCSLNEATASIFHRWFGKLVALICLQFAGVIVLVIIFAIDKTLTSQIAPLGSPAAASGGGWNSPDGAPSPTIVSDTFNLIGMVCWIAFGAFAVLSLPAIAYSIGSGHAASLTQFAKGLMLSIGAVGAGIASMLSGSNGAISLGVADPLSLEISRDEIEGSGYDSLPPPPPPPLHAITGE